MHGGVQTGPLWGWILGGKKANTDPNTFGEWSIHSMTEEDKKAMAKYGITHEQRTVFFWKDYKYERLADAVNYAKVASAKTKSTS